MAAQLHRAHGVTVLTGRAFAATPDSKPLVILDDGQAPKADLTVEALGSHPNLEWL